MTTTPDKPAARAPQAAKPARRTVAQRVEEAPPAASAAPALVAMTDGHYTARPIQRRAVPATQASAHYARSPLQRRAAATAATPAPRTSEVTATGTPGLPAALRTGLESLAGMSLDHVRVHYNSTRPPQLNALAYAQGNDIHLAHGQERHLPHEAWHVVQQHQGRVRDTLRVGGTAVNDDAGLEHEADVMGARAQQLSLQRPVPLDSQAMPGPGASAAPGNIVQRMVGDNADGKRVVERDDYGTVYIARRNTIGSYDLFDEETGTFYIGVEPDDDDYILYSDIEWERDSDSDSGESSSSSSSSSSDSDSGDSGSDADDESEDETPYSIRSDQAKRRVYTTGPLRGPGGFRDLLRQGKQDFSYPEVSQITHDALARVGEDDAADQAIATGADFALDDGDLPLDKAHDEDLQLVPYHVLAYQKFHTPPNLKREKRKRENPWREEELENTRSWLTLPDARGLKLILPPQATRLREYYPGPIDVGFAPRKGELFTYGQNKAIYKINREVLLKAYLKGQESDDDDYGKSKRARLTNAFFEVVGTQEDSVAEGREEAYVRRTFGLKRTDSESSLDEASSEDDVSEFDLSDTDAPTLRAAKRKTYLNTLGVLVKLYNRKILEDLREQVAAGDNREAARAAKLSLRKHRRLLDKLERKYGEMVKAYAKAFEEINGTITYVKSKLKTLRGIKATGEEEQLRLRYIESLQEFLEAKRSGKSTSRALDGVGVKTLKQRLKSPDESGREARKKTRGERLAAIAEEHDSTLQFGSGNGNNCLIYAIANTVGFDIQEATVNEIRRALYRGDYAGVDRTGYLPATTRVVDIITQFVLSELQDRSEDDLPSVTVHILTVIPDIAPVVVGNGAAHVYVIHDGGHYWWLKPN